MLSSTHKGRESFKFDADKPKDINDDVSIVTPTGVTVPKLNMSNIKEKMHQRRTSSNSSKGSIGRRERIRNALTGRTDGSEGPDGGPQELPDEERQDFMSYYDNDAFCRKVIVVEPERPGSIGSDEDQALEMEMEGGSRGSDEL